MLQAPPVQAALRKAAIGTIAGVGIALVYLIFQASQFYELSDPLAMDYAQVAENLSRGEGFTTKVIRPISLTREARIEGHPELTLAPLHPLVMSVMFRVFGASSKAACWTNGLQFLFTLPLVLWIGWRFFSLRVGLLATILTVFNLAMLGYAISGLETTLLGFIFTATVVLLLLHADKPAWRPWLACATGIAVASLYLTNYLWIVVLLPVAVVLLLNTAPKQRGLVGLLFVAAFIVTIAPWCYRNWALTGNPFFSFSWNEGIMMTRTHSGTTLYRNLQETPRSLLNFIVSHPREVYEKVRSGLAVMQSALPAMAGQVVAAFFLVAILIPFRNNLDRIRKALYVIFVLLFFALALYKPAMRLLLPLAPLMTLVAAALFYQLLDLRTRAMPDRMRLRWNGFAICLLVVFHALPFFLQLSPGSFSPAGAVLVTKRAADELNALTRYEGMGGSTHETIISDQPWAIAWHAKRPAIWLPENEIELRSLEARVGQVRWLTLSPEVLQNTAQEKAVTWARLWQQAANAPQVSGNWRVVQRFSNGGWILFERIPDAASPGSVIVQ